MLPPSLQANTNGDYMLTLVLTLPLSAYQDAGPDLGLSHLAGLNACGYELRAPIAGNDDSITL